MLANGHKVLIQKNGGFEAGFNDDKEYEHCGGIIVDSAENIFNDAELIIKVKEPLENEVEMLRKDQVLFTYLHLAAASKTD